MRIIRRYKERHTEGKIIYPDDSFTYCLELPWKDNKVGISCIPEGEYLVERDKTGRQQWYSIPCVKGRTHIEMHPANLTSQLGGCIAPCMYLDSGVAKSSREACKKLLEWFGDSSFIMTISKYNSFKDGKW